VRVVEKLDRRKFLSGVGKAVVASFAFPYIVSSRAVGGPGKPPASERIVLGFIGLGGMGMGHLNGFLGNKFVDVAAVADCYEPHASRAKQLVEERRNTKCDAYKDYRELLDRKDIDAVVISTPDHWHALNTIHACESGKDVYVEKPLSHTLLEGRFMVNAARRYGRVVQTGTQQRSSWEFWFACMLVRNGLIGKLHTVRVGIGGSPSCDWTPDSEPPPGLDWDLWLGPAPYKPFNERRFLFSWRWCFDYGGGMITDWGVHHLDIAQWGLGMDESGPTVVEPIMATFPTKGIWDTATSFEVHYTYPNGVKVILADTNKGGVLFEGTDGWVHVNRGFIDAHPKALLRESPETFKIQLYRSTNHHQDWLNSIKERKKPICDIEIGHRSTSVCHLANIAIRLGRTLRWDVNKEQVIDDEEANRMLLRPYRAPWHL
jgi:predicted dehydrogenase